MDKRKKDTIPEIDEELLRLQNLGILGKDFMEDIYKDFYGGDPAAAANGTASPAVPVSAERAGGAAEAAGNPAAGADEEAQPQSETAPPKEDEKKSAGEEEDPLETRVAVPPALVDGKA